MNCPEINRIPTNLLLSKFDIKPVSSRGHQALYKAPYRLDDKPSLSVNSRENIWFDHARGYGGTNVDLLMLIYNLDVSQTLKKFNEDLAIGFNSEIINSPDKRPSIKSKIVRISELKSTTLIRYLNKRNVSMQVASKYVKEVSYKNSAGSFTGIGFQNDCSGWEIRNARFKGCIGRKNITTILKDVAGLASTGKVVIFEGFIDFLSFVEMGKFNSGCALVLNSTSGTSDLIRKLKHFPDHVIECYLDNDSSGKVSFEKIKKQYSQAEDLSCLYAHEGLNDLNDYLVKLGSEKLVGSKKRGIAF